MRQKEEIAKNLASSISYIDIAEYELSKKEDYPLIIPNHPNFIELNGVKTPIIVRSKLNLGFKKKALEIIQRCVDDILSVEYQPFGALYNHLDDDYVKECLIDIIIEVEENNDPNKYNLILTKINVFFKNLELFTFSSYVKIGNFKVAHVHDFHAFKFFPNNKENWEKIIGTETTGRNQDILNHYLEDPIVFQSILELQIQALDQQKATKITMQNINDVLNIFKVLGAIGIVHEGEVQLRSHDVFLINKKTGDSYRHSGLDDIGKLGPIFDFDFFAQNNPQIISKLQLCFNSENATPLERKMINSLIWLGESLNEDHLSHKLLKMIISLESLLLDSNDRGTKSYLLEERAAFLLATNFEIRCSIANTIKEAYAVRNFIVHSGDKHPIPLILIKRLFFFAYQLNMLFLKSDKFQNFEDVRQEVKNLKFQKPTGNNIH
jgi:hypothetical protein